MTTTTVVVTTTLSLVPSVRRVVIMLKEELSQPWETHTIPSASTATDAGEYPLLFILIEVPLTIIYTSFYMCII